MTCSGIFLLTLITISQIQQKHSTKYLQRQKELKEESHGILSDSDIGYELWLTGGNFFDDARENWVCFETKNFRFRCNDAHKLVLGEHREAVDENIYGWKDGKKCVYHHWHEGSLDICDRDRIAFNKLTKGEKYVCFSGWPTTIDVEKDKTGKEITVLNWQFKKFKTRRGCLYYQGGEDCDNTEYKREGYFQREKND